MRHVFLSRAKKYNKIFSTSKFESEFFGRPRLQIQKLIVFKCTGSTGEVLSKGNRFYLKEHRLLLCYYVLAFSKC